MAAEIKRCPFCGGKAAFHSHYVMCLNGMECGATMTMCGDCTEDAIIAAWNRRDGDRTVDEGGDAGAD